ncbi:MAG TPA: SUMF1/EgtB/PvdO family nonheme iron enzyme [Lacipirellulaceae bacterium]|jgi:iron(II)-dependent oxidoreductase|nr:SUMF1/EgtB/PvdO family nonheme iron enzyme [Lacipirellulaceae bacterium]
MRRILTNIIQNWSQWLSAAVAGTVFACGLFWQNVALLGGGAAVLCLVLRQIGAPSAVQEAPRRRNDRSDSHAPNEEQTTAESPRVLDRLQSNLSPLSTDALVDELIATRRYALLLRPETKQHLSQIHIVRAIRQLDESMALVPAGRVLLGQLAEQSHSACGPADSDAKLIERNLVAVEPVYLDRFCVTNEEFQRFVDAGGYEQLEFWHEEALPALLDFVDQSGAPGPRYWIDGEYQSTEGRLPVVGISWYESWAYARWVGKRLPTDAEWTKAGAWPVESAPGRIAQRRYPWGESFDVRRAHMYGSGQNGPVAVEEYPGGTSVGGIHQLIGNVWEWTSTPLDELSDSTLHVSESVMSIRGGAFDTYFENQATCHFQSGEQSLSRRRNIGFRLALPMSDLETSNDNDLSSPTENDTPQSNLEREPALAVL